MNLVQQVKAAIPAIQAARDHGMQVSRSGMALCPFHDDHHPSLQLGDRYYCHACGATGDSIDLTARLLGISNYSAAQKLARDYGIDPNVATVEYTPPYPNIRKFREDQQLCIRVLSQHYKMLERWKTKYAPAPDCDDWDLRFVEATKELSTVDYILDCLTVGTLEERVAMVDYLLGKGIIRRLQELQRKEARDAG
jgi:hypothetical protein